MDAQRVTHAQLVLIAGKWLRNRRRCHVVLLEHSCGAEIPDAIGWRHSRSVQIECKSNLPDFLRDGDKRCRKNDVRQACERYYLTPKGMLSSELVAALNGWGLLEYDGSRVRVASQAVVSQRTSTDWQQEVSRLAAEVRRYQAQGIYYHRIALNGEEPRLSLSSRAQACDVDRHEANEQ